MGQLRSRSRLHREKAVFLQRGGHARHHLAMVATCHPDPHDRTPRGGLGTAPGRHRHHAHRVGIRGAPSSRVTAHARIHANGSACFGTLPSPVHPHELPPQGPMCHMDFFTVGPSVPRASAVDRGPASSAHGPAWRPPLLLLLDRAL